MLKTPVYFKTPRFLWLSLYVCLTFLSLFQARWAMASTYGFDETCYIEYFHRFLGEPFPACYSKSLFWGVALAWWPIGLVLKAFSRLVGIPFTQLTIPMIGLVSFIQWALSLFVIDRTLMDLAKKQGRKEFHSSLWTFFILLSIPVTHYTFRWNFYAHATELLLVSLTFYFLVNQKYKLSLFFALWTFMTRLNDIPLIVIVLCAIGERFEQVVLSRRQKIAIWSFAGICSAPIIIKFWRICFVTGYNGYYLADIIKSLNLTGLKLGVLSPYHGLLWHDSFWFFSIFYFMTQLKHLSKTQLAILGWQWVLFVIHVSQFIFWGFSENRLFIGSYIGVFISLFMYWPKMSRLTQKLWLGCIGISAFWRTWYFIAATAPGLRAWSETTGQKEVTFLSAVIQMIWSPRKTLEITAGLSPMGFSLFSLGRKLPVFSKYHEFTKYSLEGYSLWLLTLFTFAGLFFFVLISWCLWKQRKLNAKNSVLNYFELQKESEQ